MTNLRKNIAIALISAALSGVALAQDSQRAVLSGSTGGIQWTLYGPGQLQGLSGEAKNTLRVSAPPQSRVVGAKYEQGERAAILAFRSESSAQNTLDFYNRQLTEQGFTRAGGNAGASDGNTSYQRDGDRVELRETRENGVHRVRLALSGAQNNATQQNQNTQQNAQAQQGQRELQRGQTVNGVAYVLYGPITLNNIRNDPGSITLSVPEQARVLDAAREDEDLIVTIQAPNVTITAMRAFYMQLFRQQGFEVRQGANPAQNQRDKAAATFVRGNNIIEWSAEREGDNTRVLFNFEGARDDNTNANTTTGTNTNAGAPLLGYDYGGSRYEFYGPNTPTTTAPAGTLRILAPQNVNVTNVNRNGEDIILTARSNLSVQQLADAYAQQMERGGFVRQGNADVHGNRAQATFVRQDTRILWTAQRQDDNSYRIVYNFQGAAQNGNTTSTARPAPLFGRDYRGLRYDFYGPEFYAPGAQNSLENLRAEGNVIRLAVPAAARDVRAPTRTGDSALLRFTSPQELREVFDFYNQQFTRQGFNQVSGRLLEDQTKIGAQYIRGQNRVALTVEREEGSTQQSKNYEVLINFNPNN